MIYPHTEDYKLAKAWVICNKCNNALHRILPGEYTPYWWCQDELCQLQEGQEIAVEYEELGENSK